MQQNERKQGYTYYYSNSLQQDVAIHNATGNLFCRDGTIYSFAELKQIGVAGVEIPLSIHIVKRNFNGVICEITDRAE